MEKRNHRVRSGSKETSRTMCDMEEAREDSILYPREGVGRISNEMKRRATEKNTPASSQYPGSNNSTTNLYNNTNVFI